MRRGFVVPFAAIVALVVIVAVASGVFGSLGSQSIAASSKISYSDGTSRFVTTYALNSGDSTFLSVVPEKFVFASGTVLTPETLTTKIVFSPANPSCNAPLNIASQIPALSYYGEDGLVRYAPAVKFYSTGSVATSAPFVVRVEKAGKPVEKVIDATNPQDALLFTDSVDNRGLLTVKGLGFLSGKYSCATNTDLGVVDSGSATLQYVSFSTFNSRLSDAKTFCGANFEYVPKSQPRFNNEVYCARALDALIFSPINAPNGFTTQGANLRYSTIGTGITWNLPLFSAVGVVTLEADADYFNAITFAPPSQGVPAVSLSPSFVTGTASTPLTFSAVVTNVATTSGTFSVTAKANAGSVVPSVFGQTLAPGQSFSQIVTYTPPSTSVLVNDQITVTACSQSGLNAPTCASQFVSAAIKPLPTPTPVPSITPSPTPCPIASDGKTDCGDNNGGGLNLNWRLSALFCSSENQLFTWVCSAVFPIVAAVLVALVVTWLAFGFVFPPAFVVLTVAFYFVFNFVDYYWPLLVVGAFVFKHGKKKKWF